MTSALSEFSFVQALGWTLIHAAWQATLIWFVYWLVKRVFRTYSSQTRYVVACFTLGVIVASMATTFILLVDNLFGRTPLAEWLVPRPTLSPNMPHHYNLWPFGEVDWTQAAVGWISPAIPYIGIVWILLVLWHATGALRATATLSRLQYAIHVIDEKTVPGWTRLCNLLMPRRSILLGELAATTSPFTVGWLKPIVVLPIGLITTLAPYQIEAILAHELAHIRRRDYLVNILQCLAEVLLYFHPCVRALNQEIRDLREHCCDDIAVEAIGGTRKVYVESLIAVEEFRPEIPLALGAAGGSLLDRVQRLVLLQRKPEKNGVARSLATAILLLFMATFGADAAIQRVQDGRLRDSGGLRDLSRITYDMLDADQENPEFLSTLVPVLEKFRRSKGLSVDDANRLAPVLSKGARPTYLFEASKEVFLDGGLLTVRKDTPWKGGSPGRAWDLAEALFAHAKTMSSGPAQHQMVRAAVVLAAQETLLTNSVALELIIRDSSFDEISGLSRLQVHRLRSVIGYQQPRIGAISNTLREWAHRKDATPMPEEVRLAVKRIPGLAWRLCYMATSWRADDPRRAQVIREMETVPLYGPILIEMIRRADERGIPLYYSSSSKIITVP